jgi:hypothetical protein
MQLYGRITYGFSCSPARQGVADITELRTILQMESQNS